MNKVSLSLLLIAIVAFIQSSMAAEQTKNNLVEVQSFACPLCTLLVGRVRDVAEQYEGIVTEEFKKLVCSRLPSSTQNICNTFVEEYGVRVIDALLKKIDPATICHSIGLCEDSQWFRKHLTDREANLIQVEMEHMGLTSDYCAMCKYIVGEVEQYANSSRQEFEHQLLHACEVLPGSLQQICDTIVLLYGPQILDYIIEYETPEIVCQQIRLCPKQEVPVVEPVKEENDGGCELCKYVLQKVEDYIQGNVTEQKIKDALHDVCNKFPLISSSCTKFVDTYEPMIIDLLLKKESPAVACAQLRLCPSQIENTDACPTCQFVVSFVEDYVAKNETIEVIEQKLEALCNLLPPTYSAMCIQVADTYVPQIIAYVEAKYTPLEVCTLIGLCTSEQSINFDLARVAKRSQVVFMKKN